VLRHVYPQTVVSVIWQFINPTNCVGLFKQHNQLIDWFILVHTHKCNRHHDHLIKHV